jgi:hypothetical protein
MFHQGQGLLFGGEPGGSVEPVIAAKYAVLQGIMGSTEQSSAGAGRS